MSKRVKLFFLNP
ncbi:unnamed protein product [Leptidea sinapis]|uniref:Uncharacterized protein n=1 Tax=Leptidea sinapis TaxID=189913 RepID=A0A5E4QI56_9NEOP|nr:unnamed protein product [Leptidea sinapis]